MSLEQLEKQIEVANLAMERAKASGDKRMTGKLKKELKAFKKVLDKSKARLKELEKIQQQCDELSACRSKKEDHKKKMDRVDHDLAMMKRMASKDSDSYYKPIHIPWLDKGSAEDERRDEAENEREMTNLVASFGNQIFADDAESAVSSLGSQVFGTSEITKAKDKEIAKRSSKDSRDGILGIGPSFSGGMMGNMLTPEYVAEQELRAREQYIMATKEHQKLQKAGHKPGSLSLRMSEKNLRDCYAQIEYWELLGENTSLNSTGGRQGAVVRGALGKLGPKQAKKISFDAEESKARDSYLYAMMRHQGLVNSGASTMSSEWKESQKKLEECLAALQYWEERREFIAMPAQL